MYTTLIKVCSFLVHCKGPSVASVYSHALFANYHWPKLTFWRYLKCTNHHPHLTTSYSWLNYLQEPTVSWDSENWCGHTPSPCRITAKFPCITQSSHQMTLLASDCLVTRLTDPLKVTIYSSEPHLLSAINSLLLIYLHMILCSKHALNCDSSLIVPSSLSDGLWTIFTIFSQTQLRASQYMGGAITLAEVGTPPLLIQATGRWSMNTFGSSL
jgi:hypothetical protein